MLTGPPTVLTIGEPVPWNIGRLTDFQLRIQLIKEFALPVGSDRSSEKYIRPRRIVWDLSGHSYRSVSPTGSRIMNQRGLHLHTTDGCR